VISIAISRVISQVIAQVIADYSVIIKFGRGFYGFIQQKNG